MSLAVNLLVLGAVAGAFYRHAEGPGMRRHHAAAMHSYGAPYMQALPREERRALRQQMRAARDAGLPTRADRRAHLAQMLAALRAEPFSAAAVSAVLQAQGDAAQQLQQAAHTAWLQRITAMSGAERAAYADALQALLEQRRGTHRKRGARAAAEP